VTAVETYRKLLVDWGFTGEASSENYVNAPPKTLRFQTTKA
jgi:hypothetical protein